MEKANVIPINIEEEMRSSYMDYAMSVIISRALPDVRDGLKPVHRRILYAMLGEGLVSGKKYSKCAGVVGEVLKRLHPHGDMAVYNALVRMAQPWNLRYTLIDGQGNFGSVDGDSPAAYRYTECRMQALTEWLLADLDKDTVDFIPNFDDTNKEPVVLPSKFPNLLVNGSEGIAVGMVSSIPPHNLTEIINATIKVIQSPEVSIDDLMEIVPGPDFPTAGTIYGSEPIKRAYKTGKGILKIRAKIRQETIKTGKRETEAIIVDELPYQVNKARLIEKIAELVHAKKIEGISKLRDESDRQGMRIVIELKRDAVSEVVINQLYKLTQLQHSYGITMRAIVQGRPRILNLKQVLECFIDHRREIITRRTRFELDKAKSRQHILEGLRIALSHIDEVIEIIKRSESTAAARGELREKFEFSEIQANQILDMPLKRLTQLERKSIEDEYNELAIRIERFEELLANISEIDKMIVEELHEVLEKFGDERRTQIEENEDAIEAEDMIAEEDMIVTVSHRGYIKRCIPSTYRSQKRGGKGVQGTKKLEESDGDFIEKIFVASTHAYLLVFTDKGRVHWIKVYRLPEMGRMARGRAVVNMIKFEEGEKLSAVLPVRHFEDGKYVVLISKKGHIKRVNLMDFSNVRKAGIKAAHIDEDDVLVSTLLTDGTQDCIVSTRNGMVIRFAETDARVMGRSARGPRAIKLSDNDEVVNMIMTGDTQGELISEDGEVEDFGEISLLSACEKGHGKRTYLSEYRVQNRGGRGVIDIKTEERNGKVVSTCRVSDKCEVMIVSTSGKIIRMPASDISPRGRNTLGVRLVNMKEGEKLASVARVTESESIEGEEEGEE